MANSNHILLDELDNRLDGQLAEQGKLFNKLPEEKQNKIQQYVLHSIHIYLSSIFNVRRIANDDGTEEWDHLRPKQYIVKACTIICGELESGFTRRERHIATIKAGSTFYSIFKGTIYRFLREYDDRLSEEVKLSLYKEVYRIALGLFGFIERVNGELESSRRARAARTQHTEDEWRPRREKYNKLIAEGVKPAIALNEIKKDIEKETGKCVDKSTLYRQLRPKRK